MQSLQPQKRRCTVIQAMAQSARIANAQSARIAMLQRSRPEGDRDSGQWQRRSRKVPDPYRRSLAMQMSSIHDKLKQRHINKSGLMQ